MDEPLNTKPNEIVKSGERGLARRSTSQVQRTLSHLSHGESVRAIEEMGGFVVRAGDGELTASLEECSQATDAGLVHLSGLANLRYLNLGDTQISDNGMVHLKRLTSLYALQLDRTKVGDKGLTYLSALNQMWSLTLSRTQVSDAGLNSLQGLTNLTSLHLRDTQITDAGLVHLTGLTDLTTLDISETAIGWTSPRIVSASRRV